MHINQDKRIFLFISANFYFIFYYKFFIILFKLLLKKQYEKPLHINCIPANIDTKSIEDCTAELKSVPSNRTASITSRIARKIYIPLCGIFLNEKTRNSLIKPTNKNIIPSNNANDTTPESG